MKRVYGFKVSGIILPDGWKYVLGPTWWQSKWFNACVFITQHKIVIRVRFICLITFVLLLKDIHRVERRRSYPSCGTVIKIKTYSNRYYRIGIWSSERANRFYNLLQSRLDARRAREFKDFNDNKDIEDAPSCLHVSAR